MKKKIFICGIIIMLFCLTGCSENNLTSNNETSKLKETKIEEVVFKKENSEKLVQELKNKGLNIGKVVTYNEENDPNKILGRPHQYISKSKFEIVGIEQFDEEEPTGGTIEVFENEEDMKNRKEYVDAISASASIFAEYSYGKGYALLRISNEVTPTEAKKFEEAFLEIMK
jgi:hypothetical protein